MIIRKLLTVLSLGFACLSGLAESPQTSNPSDGVWIACGADKGETLFILVSEGDKLTAYNGAWVKLEDAVEGKKESFKLVIPFRRIGIHVSGGFSNGSFFGDWEIPHPQFRYEGSWNSERIVQSAEWEPWQFLDRPENQQYFEILGVADSEERAGERTEQEILENWTGKIESEYFGLLLNSLYADNAGRAYREVRQQKVKTVVAENRERGETLFKESEKCRGLLGELRSRFAARYPWMRFQVPIVLTYGFGEFDYKIYSVTRNGVPKYFLFIAIDWLIDNSRDDTFLELFLAEAIAYSAYQSAVNLPAKVPFQVIRRGASRHAAMLLLGVEYPSANDSESLKALKEEIRGKRQQPDNAFFTEFLQGERRELVYRIGAEYVREYLRTHTENQLFAALLKDNAIAFNRVIGSDRAN